MKKWVNRTWAKAAAFALTLVFAALTALGALGIAVLVSQGVFLDGGDALSAALYDEQCHSAISQADTFLRGVLTDAGLLNESSDAAGQPGRGHLLRGLLLRRCSHPPPVRPALPPGELSLPSGGDRHKQRRGRLRQLLGEQR